MPWDVQGILLVVLLGAAMIVGVLLAAVGLPGTTIILAGAVLYGWAEGFQAINYTVLLVLAGLVLAGEGAEFLAAMLGAKRAKASAPTLAAALVGAMGGGLLGTMALPILGTMVGAMAGVFVAAYGMELWVTGDQNQAKRVARRAAMGQVLGMVAKFGCAVAMAAVIIGRIIS